MPTNFSGFFTDGPGQISPKNLSADIALGTFAPGFALSITSRPLGASRGAQTTTSVETRNIAGAKIELFGGELFGRIIVIPRLKALGFVLSQTQFPIEVWNTSRDVNQILETISIDGSGGLTLADTFGEPLQYAALDSFIYQATVPSAGPAVISEDVVFAFLSGIGGADCAVTGSRITVFSVPPDWSEGVKEKISYLTDVLKSYSDNEQRRGLRQFARRAIAYRAVALTARNAAGMESLIWGWQNQPYGVPWWQDSQPLTSDISAGSFSIPVNTADRMFAAGGLVVIWQDEFTFEALNIVSLTGSALVLSSPTQFSWKAGPGTRVIPVFLCRLGSSVKVDRITSFADQVDVEFIGEAQQPAPAPSVSLTQYKSIDVLEVPPNWDNPPSRTYKRSLVTMDPKIGPITVDDQGGSAVVSHDFPWFLTSRADMTTFRAFLRQRFGQLNSFWLPTFDQDLVLSSDVGSADVAISIQSEFYSRFFFPVTARRDIAFIPQDRSGNVYRRITAAVDNGDGTETLTLDSPTGKNFKAAGTMISFLALGRLGSDDAEISWGSTEFAASDLEVQEVPREIP